MMKIPKNKKSLGTVPISYKIKSFLEILSELTKKERDLLYLCCDLDADGLMALKIACELFESHSAN